MPGKKLSLTVMSVFALVLFLAASHASPPDTPTAAALIGQVTSAEEGPMEGVLVSAKKDGATIRITVVTDRQGRYSFPAAKLEPGHYNLAIRAAGYDLDGPASADVVGGKPATADLKLRKAKNLSAQLSNAEWLASIPGTEQEKRALLDCTGCHTLQRILRSTHDADEFVQVFDRMSKYYNGSTPLHPQLLVGGAREGYTVARSPEVLARAKYLAGINLSQGPAWEYPLQTLPRPTGRAAHVIITEYDLTRPDAEPHDVIVDSAGMVWYTDFGRQFIGNLDPKTGKVTEFPVPELKKGFPTGTLNIEPDKDGNLWVSLMFQGGIARFDPKSQTFKVWAVPDEWQSNHTQESCVTPN
jgi:virginiamycin B lyase